MLKIQKLNTVSILYVRCPLYWSSEMKICVFNFYVLIQRRFPYFGLLIVEICCYFDIIDYRSRVKRGRGLFFVTIPEFDWMY